MLWLLFLGALILFVVLPVVVFALEVFLACLPVRSNTPRNGALPRPKIAILVPAHNEEKVIEKTLANVTLQLCEADRLIVVADNCTDATASIAHRLGATVLERENQVQKGKGYALEHGVQYLAEDPPDIVIVVDADCLLGVGVIDKIAKLAQSESRPVQALYLMKHNNADPSLAQRVAAFAWNVKNHARPLGCKVLGLPCQLMGTGMAFPFSQLNAVKLGSGNIVEDMQLGLDLTALGHPTLFCPDAVVTSFFPESVSAEQSQRRRWEHGHIGVILGVLPPLLVKAIATRNLMLLSLLLDLAVPPLTLLAVIVVLALFVTGFSALFLSSALLFHVSFLSLCIFSVAVFIAWLGFGREFLSIKDVILLPKQILAKLPLYAHFFTKRQKKWERTERDD